MALNCKIYQFVLQIGCHISWPVNKAEEEDCRQRKAVHPHDKRDIQVINDRYYNNTAAVTILLFMLEIMCGV